MSAGPDVTLTLPGGGTRVVPAGTPLRDALPTTARDEEVPLVGVLDHHYVDLSTPIERDATVAFQGLDGPAGARAYRHGLGLLIAMAASRCCPGQRVALAHSLGGCVYGKVRGRSLSEALVVQLRDAMRDLVAADLPIHRVEVPTADAINWFENGADAAKLKLLHEWPSPTVTVYRCDGSYHLFSGPMVERTGLLDRFDLVPYPPGFLLRLPDNTQPDGLGITGNRPKLFRIFYEYERWGEVLGVATAGDINEAVRAGEWDSLVHVAEALHEKKIAAVADQIVARDPLPRLVLIAGPSASGKTSFARRLATQLRVLGMRPRTLSVDDYFVDRDKTPRDAEGKLDFESLEAIDVDLFNAHLASLMDGHSVRLPRYDFSTGLRGDGNELCLDELGILIVEGIHGLNDALTPRIWPHLKFKIYVSALTHLNVDDQNAIATSDERLVRRIVRDARTRGYTAADTLARWPSVRAGEEKHIFPFQESADVMFNSALVVELNILKSAALAALGKVPPTVPEHAEAERLTEFLKFFCEAPADAVPSTSILREFIGGSAFREVR